MGLEDASEVTISDFVAMTLFEVRQCEYAALVHAFRPIDENSNGYITHSEVKVFLSRCNETDNCPVTPKLAGVAKDVMNEADVDKDHQINFGEFCQYLGLSGSSDSVPATSSPPDRQLSHPSLPQMTTGICELHRVLGTQRN